MDFLVAARDVALLIDPYQCVLDFLTALGRFVDADVDGELAAAGFIL